MAQGEAGKPGGGAAGRVPVFGILERKGEIAAGVVPNVSAEILSGLIVEKGQRGKNSLYRRI
ncbi:MAG: hypothetical protein JW984_09935 [Deltaproteobacteria bacterium]|uniref:Uncharacterized protein n=1 Tax=Candidatus Zymogenus saltonus TaxID=2844893 RepID=A0A9D8KEJ6_9DELT|nr:hypothetical protein [Candidatus Zymogenus saltonus]